MCGIVGQVGGDRQPRVGRAGRAPAARAASPSRARRRRNRSSTRSSRSATCASPSSTRSMAPSPSSPTTATSSLPTTARSTTTSSCATSCAREARRFARRRTRRFCSRATGTGAHACSTGSTACSRSRSTTRPVASSFARATRSGRSPSTGCIRNRRFAFASECRAFACLPGFAAELDLASIADFLAFECLPFDRSIYRDVHKLPPGHALRYRDGKVEIDRYFESVPARCARMPGRRGGARDRAPPPFGRAHLSRRRPGRIALERRPRFVDGALVPARGASVGAASHVHDSQRGPFLRRERGRRAACVAVRDVAHRRDRRACGARRRRERDPRAARRAASRSGASLPKYLVCREIARTSKVALTGDGGDELFYGYAIFRAQRAARLVRRLPDVVHRRLLGPLARSLPASDRYMGFDLKVKQFAKGFPAPDHCATSTGPARSPIESCRAC